jgi:hypothetical protein
MRTLSLAVTLALLVLPTVGSADSVYVPDNFTSIQSALSSANPGDFVFVRAGTYSERISIPEGVELHSMDGPELTTIDGGGVGRTVDVNGVTAKIRGFTITGGFGPSNGGGMRVWDGATVEILNCVFTGNDASGLGGGLAIQDSQALVSDCTFESNTASSGAALYIEGNVPADVLVQFCDFAGNVATGHGGAVFGTNGGFQMMWCRLHDNAAGTLGGAMSLDGATPEISDTSFYGNVAIEGGGISFHNSSAGSLLRCTFYVNEAALGGAISCTNDSSPTITQCILAASLQGAALNCAVGSAPVVSCSNLWGNLSGDGICGTGDLGNNLSVDPEFCQVAPEGEGDFMLQSDSPCAAANSPCGLQIGSGGVGCSVSPVEVATWGRIKSTYR